MSENLAQPGDLIGKYRILAHVATGGMGTVYKALDEGLDRVVALKVLPLKLNDHPTLMERFRREARHAAKLIHRNIVTIYEFDQDRASGLYYLAMEFIQGMDLADYIRKRGK